MALKTQWMSTDKYFTPHAHSTAHIIDSCLLHHLCLSTDAGYSHVAGGQGFMVLAPSSRSCGKIDSQPSLSGKKTKGMRSTRKCFKSDSSTWPIPVFPPVVKSATNNDSG